MKVPLKGVYFRNQLRGMLCCAKFRGEEGFSERGAHARLKHVEKWLEMIIPGSFRNFTLSSVELDGRVPHPPWAPLRE